VLALAAAVRLRVLATLLGFGLCVWVHPTMVFLAPVLIGPFVAEQWPHIRQWKARVLVIGALVLLALGALSFAAIQYELWPGAVLSALRGDILAKILERASKPTEFAHFMVAYLDLLSGPTIYRYIVGSLSERASDIHFWLALLVVLPTAVLGTYRLKQQGNAVDLGVVIGLCVALTLEYLIGGPNVLAPKTERYAMCLTVPACYLLASWLEAFATTPLRAVTARVTTTLVGAALLASFSICYLAGLHTPDSKRENTFRTGPVELKRKALREVLRMRDPSRITLIYTEDWWIYWTIRYLAPPESGARVTIQNQRWDYRFPRDYELPNFSPDTMDLFAVAWADGPLDRKLTSSSLSHVDIRGYEPSPILRAHKLNNLDWTKKPRPKRRRH
jgi:hypothetical protein